MIWEIARLLGFDYLYYSVPSPSTEEVEFFNNLDSSAWQSYLTVNISSLLLFADNVQLLSDSTPLERRSQLNTLSTNRGWRWPQLSTEEKAKQNLLHSNLALICSLQDQSYASLALAINNLNGQIALLRNQVESDQ